MLTASGASLVTPTAGRTTAAAEHLTAQAVASVWRSAGTVDAGAGAGAGAGAAGAGAADALLAEVATRDGGSVSRSEDRSAVVGEVAVEAVTGTPADPVAQAAQQVQALVVQQDADGADDALATDAAASSAAEARDAVDVARALRDAEAAAAALAAAQADPRPLAATMVAGRGWDGSQLQCLDRLWTKESGWRWSADNPTSSAYGIPQALPGAKMASAGADWETNPVTQIAWGLGYIADRYGTPCAAWAHSRARGWY